MTVDKIIRHIEIELMRHMDNLESKHVHSSQKEWVRGNISALNDVLMFHKKMAQEEV